MLDPGSQQILDLILAKDPATIDELDREWLTARRSYLSEAQLKAFDIKEPEEVAVSEEVSEEVEEAPDAVKTEGKKKVVTKKK